MLIQNFLEDSSRKYPHKTALVQGEVRVTYSELNSRANRFARLLKDCGVARGERVAIYLDNSIEAVVALFGALKADAVFTVLSGQMKAQKLGYILANCGAKVLVSDWNRHNASSESLRQAEKLECAILTGDRDRAASAANIIPWESARELSAGEVPSRNIDMDLAAIIYTSGSTGMPKGVMLTHLNMKTAADSVIAYLENVPEDIIMNVLPLSFSYGLYQVITSCRAGATVILEKSFAYPMKTVRKIQDEKATGFPGVPTIFALLLQMRGLDRLDLSSLRYITSAGAVLPLKTIRRIREAFPHARLYSMYGLTECKRVSYLPPQYIDSMPQSVGRGMPNQEVWIAGEDGNPVGPGTTGELVVRGSHIMKGYWGDEELTKLVLRPGRNSGERVLHTGDLFRMDEEGFLYFQGRKDELIKTRGERVSPLEVEKALCELEGVSEAAVVPVQDDILGNAVKAYIVPRADCTLDSRQVLFHCRKHLDDYAVPKYFEFRASLPKTVSGKIDKLALRETEA